MMRYKVYVAAIEKQIRQIMTVSQRRLHKFIYNQNNKQPVILHHCLILLSFLVFSMWQQLQATSEVDEPLGADISTIDTIGRIPTPQSAVDFLIEDIRVDITATSSQVARNQAIFAAQQQALKKLIEKIAPGFDESKLAALQEHEIEFMVQDFGITHEKISNIRYIATFTIRFNPVAIKQFLKKMGGQNLVDVPKRAVEQTGSIVPLPNTNWLIIPVFKIDDRLLLWEEDNSWYQQWEQYDFDKAAVLKYTLPIRDLTDFNILSTQDAIEGHVIKLDALLGRYNIDHAVIAILNVNHAGAVLQLQLYKLHETKVVAQNVSLNSTSLTESGILHEALKKTLVALSTPSTPKKVTRLIIGCEFSSYGEWLKIRHVFDTLPTTQPLVVKSLKKDYAEIQICIDCSMQDLMHNLLNHRYQIVKIKAQRYKLTNTNQLSTHFDDISSHHLPAPVHHYIPQRSQPYYTPAEVR